MSADWPGRSLSTGTLGRRVKECFNEQTAPIAPVQPAASEHGGVGLEMTPTSHPLPSPRSGQERLGGGWDKARGGHSDVPRDRRCPYQPGKSRERVPVRQGPMSRASPISWVPVTTVSTTWATHIAPANRRRTLKPRFQRTSRPKEFDHQAQSPRQGKGQQTLAR